MGGQSLKEKRQEEDQLQEMEGHRQKASSGNYAQRQLNRQVWVTLVNMVMCEELSEKMRARNDTYQKRKSDEAQGRADR